MANEPTRPSTPDGTTAEYRSQATPPDPGTLRQLAAFAAGAPFTALVAAVEVTVVTVALGVPLSTAPVAVGLVAFAVYAADHVADAEGDAGSTPLRARIAFRYGDQLTVAAAVSYGLAVALAWAVAVVAAPLAFAGVPVDRSETPDADPEAEPPDPPLHGSPSTDESASLGPPPNAGR
ncbi:hypothetical protein C463_08027 [Halorubrum californiense DSM 19288]|uniref:Uncharacterized protein n=1 Tax=Halorubrum californiense DSM 19288 TaxID=1227465 RepID=M0ECX2_9EURY|nr:hypothetical protein C463_08027 [Halorubrum californiense DSM 19288]TKX68422.1 hypothetical protein EXE40_12610 [Halorubrum sp. GN11GM_10-3_MGM]